MKCLLLILSSLISASFALSDFRVTFQLTGLNSRTRDGVIVKTDCFSDAPNQYSDWAYGPVSGFGGMKIGLEKCSGSTITDQDIRLCVQAASSSKEGTIQCTDWASDGAGGWSEFAQTVDGDHIYKARVKIETQSATDLTFNDIQVGIRATDLDEKGHTKNPIQWGKPSWTGFLTQSGEHGVYTNSVCGKDKNDPIKAIKVYFEADTGTQHCCTLGKGKARYYQTCASEARSQSKTSCENVDIDGAGSSCEWVDCSDVGYCEWDGVLGRAQKGKRTCGAYMNAIDCGQGNGGRSGCEWQSGAPPESYYMDYDYNNEEKVDMSLFKSDIKTMRLLKYQN